MVRGETARGEPPPIGDRSERQPQRWPTDPYDSPAERYGTLRTLLARGGTAGADDASGANGAADAAGADGAAGNAARDEAIATLKDSGLRGMGGAGFPAGAKWDYTRRAEGNPKYVVCNADESEPGTFKDREILAQLPYLMLEAMAIAGWAIGAEEGIVYLRHEYGRERELLKEAIREAERMGALGDGVFGTSFRFQVRLFVSPGGYILGEETALLEALEDRRGEPRNKPPFPTTHGLWGRPTLMNNVETLAAVPAILAKGADWWRAQGKGEAAGLKFISVAGDVARPGVHCVPMGTTVSELIERCGGMAEGRALLGFMPGGVSSNVLSAAERDVPMDFDPLQRAGSMLGSGALIVFGEGRDLLTLGLNGVRFFRNESCGKCVPCRVGSQKAAALIEEALAGRPQAGLIPLLRNWGRR